MMQAGIQVIATIPSREVLLGKLLGSIQSPITNFARVTQSDRRERTEKLQQRLNLQNDIRGNCYQQ